MSREDRISQRWAVAITAVLGLLLASMAVRGDEAALFHRPRTNEARSPTLDQAICFLKKRPGGAARLRRPREARWIERLAKLIDEADPLRQADMSHGVVLAISFHESSWKPRSMGALGEHGLMQIHPARLRAAGLRSGEDPLDPSTNLRLGINVLGQCSEMCNLQRGQMVDRNVVIQCYATGSCGEPIGLVRLMGRWADEADACRSQGG